MNRDTRLDFLKGILIFLVVLGHYIEHMIGDPFYGGMYKAIYMVHMPLFVYVSGLAFRLSGNRKNTALFVWSILIFQGIYWGVSYLIYGQIGMDYWILWYLYAMIFWTAVTPENGVTRQMLVASIALGLLWGMLPQNDMWRFSRILGFLPFFWMGYMKLHEELHIAWLLTALETLALGLVLAWATADYQLFYFGRSYEVVGMSIQDALIGRTWVYTYTLLLFTGILWVLRFVPMTSGIVRLGANSLPVFLVHGMLAKIISGVVGIGNIGWLVILSGLTCIWLGTPYKNKAFGIFVWRLQCIWLTIVEDIQSYVLEIKAGWDKDDYSPD